MEQRGESPLEVVAPFPEARDEIYQSGGEAVKYCYECGKCDTVCPWNRVRDFSVRRIIREAVFGFTAIESEDIWRCTTCGRCSLRCPRGVKQPEAMVAFRRVAAKYGVFPAPVRPLRAAGAGLSAESNPFGAERAKRADWAAGLPAPVKTFAEGTQLLYFPGCYPCYDPRLKKVARATAHLLTKAGADFGILGAKENCCGESIRKAGNEELFKRLARENIMTFVDNGVEKILVSSPHCYHTFKNEYPQFRVNFEVIHITQYLHQLLCAGKLKPSREFKKRVTYHDPCYLGRHNGIFDEPREVLRQVPGLELVELPEAGKNSLCCGMGGGGIWIETPKEQRFANLRLQQAVELNAEVLVTSCPYCLTGFEDSRLTQNYSERIEIKDITEILQEVV